MLKEALLGLAGIRASWLCSPRRRDFIERLPRSEQCALQPLAQLAVAVARLNEFVQRHEAACEGSPASLYTLALGRALQGGLLHDYQQQLVHTAATVLRADKLSGSHMPLVAIRSALYKFEVIMPSFVDLVDEVESNGLRGIQVLDSAHRLLQNGMPDVQFYANKLFSEGLDGVLLRQLSSWIGHGVLADPYDEMWIQRNRVTEQSWNSEFTLRIEMIPDLYIPASTARSVLFIGKAIRVLNQAEEDRRRRMREGCPSFEENTFQDSNTLDIDSLVSGIHELENDSGYPMDTSELQKVIENIRVQVAACLWRLIVEQADLLQHFRLLKDFFFMANGAFYEEFIVESHDLLSLPPTRRAELDINESAFQVAASKFSLDEHPLFRRLHLTLPPSSFSLSANSSQKEFIYCGDSSFGSSDSAIVCMQASSPLTSSHCSSMWNRSRWTIDDGFHATYKVRMTSGHDSFVSFVLQNDRLEALGTGCGGLAGIGPALALRMHGHVLSESSVALGTSLELLLLATEESASVQAVHSCDSDVDIADGQQHQIEIIWSPFKNSQSPEGGFFKVLIDSNIGLDIQSKKVFRAIRLLGRRTYVGVTSSGSSPLEVSNFSFREAAADLANSSSSDAWRRLSLKYHVPAPLDLVLRDQELDRYADIFQMLFRVKRVHFGLRQAWGCSLPSKLAALLRAKMAFLIDNLLFYLHVDVLEVQFKRLCERVRQSHDFESVCLAHDQYLSTLVHQCFLQARVIIKAFEHVFDLCGQFCKLSLNHPEQLSEAKLRSLSEDFERESCFLFTILSKKTTNLSTTHLAQLVLRINFNQYFGKASAQLGLS